MAAYYVDKDNGNDANSGLTEALAKATIQAATTLATGTKGGAPDTIYIQKAATAYAETVTTGDKELRFVGYETTITDCVKVPIDGASTRVNGFTATLVSNFCYLWFENLEIYGHTGDGIVLSGAANSGVHIFNCSIHDNGGHGFNSSSRSYGLAVIHSAFYSNGGSGFLCDFQGNPVLVVNSVFYKNTSWGLHCATLSARGSVFAGNGAGGAYCSNRFAGIDQCVFDGNTGTGLQVAIPDTDPVFVRASVFANNTTYGLTLATSVLTYLDDCGFYSNTSGARTGGSIAANFNELTSDPAFVARYNSVTNTNPLNFDYRITNASYKSLARQVGPFVGDSDWGSSVNIGAQFAAVSGSSVEPSFAHVG